MDESRTVYSAWKDYDELPIECLINMCLLLNGKRNIIQFDITFYDDQTTKDCIDDFLEFCDEQIIKYRDIQDNIVIYLKKNREKIEKQLLGIGNGYIMNAFRTTKFADVLDPIFYKSKGNFPEIFKKKRIVQVSINVIHEKSCGAILIQMCDINIGKHLKKLYSHFHFLSKCIEEIDPHLQTTLTFHTKPGLWKESAELVVKEYHKLNHI